MSIRRLFDATRDQMYKSVVGYDDSDILTDQRVIIVNRNARRLIQGQLTMMFDEDGATCLIASHYRVPWFSLIAYLHALEQAKWLRDAGIMCSVALEKGSVICTYSRIGWLQWVAQYSPTSSRAQKKQKQQQPTPSEVSLDLSSPKMQRP